MKVNEVKLKFLNDKVQVVVFDADGDLIETCNTLVKFDKKESLFDQFPALEAVSEEVCNIEDDDVLYYPCLNNSFGELGYHDLYFEIHTDTPDKKTFLLFIHDLTNQYGKMLNLQQSRNETDIDKERLLQKNKELKVKNQLFSSSEDTNKHVFIKIDSLLLNFDTSSLYYIEAYGDYVKLHTKDKIYLVYSTLKKVEGKLPQDMFVKIHRSYIVNITKITNIHASHLEIKEKILPISSLNKSKFMKKINIL